MHKLLLNVRIALLGAGVHGAMALFVPPAHAIDELVLEQDQPAAHEGDAVRAVGFAADGAGGEWVISGGEDAVLRSWTPELFQERALLLDHTIYDLAASPDGSIVITGEGGWNGGTNADTLRVSSASGIEFGTGAPIGYVYVVAVSPDERWTVASGFYGDILVYETAGLELYATQATGKKRTKSLAFSPDGSLLASTAKGGTIQLWSFPQDDCAVGSCELTLLLSLSHPGSWDVPLAFAPDSTAAETRFVSSSDSGTVSVWSVEGLARGSPSVSVLSVDSDAVRSLAWSPDASMIVAGGDGELLAYDADTLEVLAEALNGHTGRVNSVAFSPDSARIASGGNDGTLNLWRSPRPTRPRGCGLGPELALLLAPLGWRRQRSERGRLARLRPARNEPAGTH